MSANPFCTPPLEGMLLLAVIFCDTYNGTMGNTPGNGETLVDGALGMAVKNSWRSPLPLVTIMCFAVISVAPPNVSSMCCGSINCCVAILTPSTATLVVASKPPPLTRSTVPAGRYPPPGVTLRNHMAPPERNAPGVAVTVYGFPLVSSHGARGGSMVTGTVAPAFTGAGRTATGSPPPRGGRRLLHIRERRRRRRRRSRPRSRRRLWGRDRW